eukprot:766607-Hanusia_phi.AAC.3
MGPVIDGKASDEGSEKLRIVVVGLNHDAANAPESHMKVELATLSELCERDSVSWQQALQNVFPESLTASLVFSWMSKNVSSSEQVARGNEVAMEMANGHFRRMMQQLWCAVTTRLMGKPRRSPPIIRTIFRLTLRLLDWPRETSRLSTELFQAAGETLLQDR